MLYQKHTINNTCIHMFVLYLMLTVKFYNYNWREQHMTWNPHSFNWCYNNVVSWQLEAVTSEKTLNLILGKMLPEPLNGSQKTETNLHPWRSQSPSWDRVHLRHTGMQYSSTVPTCPCLTYFKFISLFSLLLMPQIMDVYFQSILSRWKNIMVGWIIAI